MQRRSTEVWRNMWVELSISLILLTPGKIVRGRLRKPKPQFTKGKWPWRECVNLLMSGDQKSLKHFFFSITHFLSPCSTLWFSQTFNYGMFAYRDWYRELFQWRQESLGRILTTVCSHTVICIESISNNDRKAKFSFLSAQTIQFSVYYNVYVLCSWQESKNE